MVFWAYGDHLVVLVNFHKTTVTTHKLVCGLTSWKKKKGNCNLSFGVWSVTRSYTQRTLTAYT